jgi:predicted O-linked N-acetylglucosamine transferase (SPINDLY family)
MKGGIWEYSYGTDEKVAYMVREDQVDIWVELTGHIANNKLGVITCRPAPSILNKSVCILFFLCFSA